MTTSDPDIGQAYHAEIASQLSQLGAGATMAAWGELTPEQQGHWREAAVHAYASRLRELGQEAMAQDLVAYAVLRGGLKGEQR